jgi:hypothetical protein
MKLAQMLDYVAVALAAMAAGVGLASSYPGAEAALLGLGIVLVFRAVLSKAPLRLWSLEREQPPSRSGPVSALALGLRDARNGSHFSQTRVASVLRSIFEEGSAKRALPKELLEPSESGHRLKGRDYMAAVEAALEVLRND